MKTPLVFMVFNRPDTTQLVFEAIKKARPPRLLLIADGPRPEKEGEAEQCGLVRSILEEVDWPCHVQKNYSDVNMGCKRRISTGLDWVFSEVEEAIILEDDCLPDPSFFPFCEELLDVFRLDERVGHISGVNFQFGSRPSDESYYFSRYPHVWGWASWRRAWQDYDVEIRKWPSIKSEGKLLDIFGDKRLAKRWGRIFDRVHGGIIDTWDYQWAFTNMINNRLSITPHCNLVSNIGYGDHATHTQQKDSTAEVPVESMIFPLKHPRSILRNCSADRNTDQLNRMTFTEKLINSIRKRLYVF